MLKEKAVKVMNELFRLEVPEELKAVVQEGGEIIGIISPYINGFINHMEHKKIKKSIKAIEERLDVYELSLLNTEDFDYIKHQILPLTINIILKEEQEEKFGLAVNGLNNCIKKRFYEKDMIITYYDVLSSLRSIDLAYLMSLAESNSEFNILKKDIENLIVDKSEEGSERRVATGYIIKKLSRLDLVSYPKTFADLGGENPNVLGRDFKLTDFAINFLKFIQYRRENRIVG
jgi:hypothetical protein